MAVSVEHITDIAHRLQARGEVPSVANVARAIRREGGAIADRTVRETLRAWRSAGPQAAPPPRLEAAPPPAPAAAPAAPPALPATPVEQAEARVREAEQHLSEAREALLASKMQLQAALPLRLDGRVVGSLHDHDPTIGELRYAVEEAKRRYDECFRKRADAHATLAHLIKPVHLCPRCATASWYEISPQRYVCNLCGVEP